MIHRVLLSLLFIAGITRATAGKPFPKAVTSGDKLATKETATAKLPAKLQKLLLKQEVFQDENGQLPARLFTARFDLNGDGTDEIFVDDPASYTGGTSTYLFSKEEDGYSLLGAFLGIECLTAPSGGYPGIVTFSKAGGGVFVRELWQFENGEYVSVRAAEYKFDENDNEVFIREIGAEEADAGEDKPDLPEFLQSPEGTYGWEPVEGEISYDFFKDGRVHIQGKDGEATMWEGTWSLKGDQLTVVNKTLKKTRTFTAAADGEALLLDGDRYRRVKAE